MPVINLGGRKVGGAAKKPASRTNSTARKPAAKRTATRTASKPVAKKSAARTAAPERVNRSPKTDMSQSQLNKLLGPLGKKAVKREQLYEQWKDAVSEVNDLILEALDAEVPVGMIVYEAQISRQHLYKLIGERSKNGSGSKTRAKAAAKTATRAKPVAKKTATRTVAKKTPARKPAAKRGASAKRTIKRR